MPVRSDEDSLSDRYGLDRRTVHLLPAKCPEHPTATLISPDPPSYSVLDQRWQGMNHNYNNSGNKYNYTSTPYWRRYAAILEKSGSKYFAKVIIQEELEPWAKKRGFTILKQFRMYGSINDKMEKTEFSRRGAK